MRVYCLYIRKRDGTNFQLGVKKENSLFYDIVSGQSPDYLQDLLPITVGQTNNYNLRNSKNFTIPPGLYQSSFFPSTIRLWNNLPTDLRNSPCQQMFKNEIRKVYDIPEKPPLYFSTGIRIANILHARLRQKCSSLKSDLFRCNLIASCNCDCGNYIESVDRFFLKCNIYTEHRIQLFRGFWYKHRKYIIWKCFFWKRQKL